MRRSALLAFALLTISLFVPLLAQAGGIPFFGPIIPPENATCAAGWGLLIVVVNNVISLLLTLTIVFVAPLMIAWAGFLFVVNPVSAGGKEKAKSILTHTVVGIVIALSSWLIIGAVMAVLYKPPTGSSWGTWTSLITGGGPNVCLPLATTLSQVSPTTPPGIGVVPTPVGSSGEQAVRARLAAVGVTINKNPCGATQMTGPLCGTPAPSCTNVANLQEATIQQIINIANACGNRPGFNMCGVQVTGGTEPGHACGTDSHEKGFKVDFKPNAALNTYIQALQSTTPRGGANGGPAWKDTCGNVYVRESGPDHWDITVKEACGTKARTVPPPVGPPIIPAGCTVQEVTWLNGNNYLTSQASNIQMTGDMALKASLSYFGNKTSGAYRYGNVMFYELGADINYSISASPCDYAASPPANACQGTISGGQTRDRYYVSNDSPPPPNSSYCKLPALPSGQTFYYVNVRPIGPFGTFFLLFD